MVTIYCNNLTVSVTDNGWKMAFGESPDGSNKGVEPRAVIFVTDQVARSVVDLLIDVRNKIDAAKTP